MQRILFNYSLKNIGLPSKNQYQRRLIEKVKNVVRRMRWKAHFFLKNEKISQSHETYGFQSKYEAPNIPEMKQFEDDIIKLVSDISYRNVNNQFLKNITNDLKKINNSEKILIFADKTRNLYETNRAEYDKLLKENVTKTYKRGEDDVLNKINQDIKDISTKLLINDRVDPMAKHEAFITLKDHKENFQTNPKCRLINPAKSPLGKVSKTILENINNIIRESTKVNQWKNTQSVIDWFKSISDKPRHLFVSFDIVDFYPSISEILLDKAITWAQTLTNISAEQINIIKHARKSILFSNQQQWIKRNHQTLFDVTMGSYDGAEVCELVGLYLLNEISKKFSKKDIGLYRDDGLLLLEGSSGRIADKARKELCQFFKKFGLNITAEVNMHIVNFLDITLNLQTEKFMPYRKPNNDPLYIDNQSNHPPSILKQLPISINQRIQSLSSDQQCFESAIPLYNNALYNSHFNYNMQYNLASNENNNKTPSRRRQRNIIWFNPPYSKSVKTNIARKFLNLIDKHFPRSHKLHKIFNRNSVKVSYSCMENVKSQIDNHNKRILKKSHDNETIVTPSKLCNCRILRNCPLQGNCLTKNIIYKATIETNDDQNLIKEYIGMTANTFKERYRNHLKSFKDEKYKNETELSKYIWKLKNEGKQFFTKWSIASKAKSYSSGQHKCNLCIEEKLCIILADKDTLLNKRREIFAQCRHAKKFSARMFKATQPRFESRQPPTTDNIAHANNRYLAVT